MRKQCISEMQEKRKTQLNRQDAENAKTNMSSFKLPDS